MSIPSLDRLDYQDMTAKDTLYALVVVLTPLSRKRFPMQGNTVDTDNQLARTFHYHVPENLRARITLGQLVWVPFGKRYLQGIIVGFDDHSPIQETRPIDQIVDDQPVMSSQFIHLARWMSDYYVAPLATVIDTLLPPGITQHIETFYSAATDPQLTIHDEAEAELVCIMQEAGRPLTKTMIQNRAKNTRIPQTLERLVRRGVVIREQQIKKPAARPHMTRVIRTAENWRASVSPRAHAQLKLGAWLEHQGQRWIDPTLAAQTAGVSTSTVRSMIENGTVQVTRKRLWRDPLLGRQFVSSSEPALTSDQEKVWRTVAKSLGEEHPRPILLQGVTGSGKTEIYLRAVRRVLERGESAIVLVPEIALTPQTIRRFGARFADTLAILHSKLSTGERYDQWYQIRSGEKKLVVGSRSALFAPVQKLGLIVIDEEHEFSYKQERTPCYHARECAVKLAQIQQCTLLLGSATPALESSYAAERGIYQRVVMPRRIMGHRAAIQEQVDGLNLPTHRYDVDKDTPDALFADLPQVHVVDMRAELKASNTSILSRRLQSAIQQSLDRKEQIILFLNRRGSASFVSCRDCGHVVTCPRCLVPLTYHAGRKELLCHHCNRSEPNPRVCPECGSRRIRYFGAGTQKVEEIVKQRFPGVRVIRWDLDTTGGKQDHERILEQFIEGQANIMVGTQMIAKGLDLPRVTLVGVISADTMLNLPDLRANERTFQLLTQVAGRAGRSILGGQVVIQTYTPENRTIQAASRHDYGTFYDIEMAFRREHWYPPLSHMARLLYLDTGWDRAKEETARVAEAIRIIVRRQGLSDVRIIGPAPAFFGRIRNRYRWQIIVQGTDPGILIRQLQLPVGWRIDIDPVSFL